MAKILIVDDDYISRKLLQVILEEEGAVLYFAENGVEGLDMYTANRKSLDFIILDIAMPEKDGIQTFQEIRQLDPNIKVLLISGYSDSKRIVELRKMRNLDFVKKPFLPTELVTRIVKATGQNQAVTPAL